MKKWLFILALLCALPIISQAQGQRYGDNSGIISVLTPGGPLLSVPGSTISWCNSPANAVPCTNKATTYTDITLTTPCSTSTQVVLRGTNSCVGSTDPYGNWGVWVAAGTYSYTVTLPGGASIGPYDVTLSGGGGGGAGNPGGSNCQLQFNQASIFGGLPDFCFTSPHTLTIGASGILNLAAGATLNGITNAMLPLTLTANTNGGAAKWLTPRLIAGNSMDGSTNVPFPNAFVVGGTADAGLTGAQFLGALPTCMVKNTTGAAPNLSCAVLADLPFAPTAPNNVPQVITSTPSGGVAGAPTASLPGLSNRTVGGSTSTDTILTSDCIPKRIDYQGTAAVAVNLPTATTLGVPNCTFRIANDTASAGGNVTVTPTTWTINHGGTYGSTSIVIAQGQIASFTVDAGGTAWDVDIPASTGSVSGMTGGQVAIAGTATTVTSSKALAGAGAGITTGPTSSTSADVATFTGTGGQVADSAKALAGSGAGVTTGPASGVTSGDLVSFTGTGGQVADSDVAAAAVAVNIASGTAALGTSAISSGACATVVTVSASGVASTDVIQFTPNASIKAVTGYAPSTSGGLAITAYPTANNVSFDVCNWSTGSITPGAVTLNWRVAR